MAEDAKARVGLDVRSEIGALEEVVVHCPGPEIRRMTQHDLERLLFDDLLSPAETAREHAVMCTILQEAGARVHEVTDILERALDRAPVARRGELLHAVGALAGAAHLAEVLTDWESKRLAEGLVSGIFWRDLEGAPVSLARLRARVYDPTDMALRPAPNLMFMRDPCVVVGDHLVAGRMARAARARESLLVSFGLRWGMSGGYAPLILPMSEDTDRGPDRFTLEGGDVLVLSPKVVMVGCSERTSAQGIEKFAHELLFPNQPDLERVYAVMLPEARSLMHLDTILTQIDDGLFLGHAPLLARRTGHLDTTPLSVARLARDKAPELVEGASVLDVLREEFGSEVQLVPCGGDDPLQQEREQWTDGANAVCVAPGRIILYSRNVRTIEALAQHGFEEVRLSAVQSVERREALVREGMKRDRTVFSFSGSELSRARGGGRCLTMPLRRAHRPVG